jgi:hypothetical protein
MLRGTARTNNDAYASFFGRARKPRHRWPGRELTLALGGGDDVVEPICELIRFMGHEIDRHDPHRWFAQLAIPVRNRLIDAEVYEYVEIMP